jgi:hypothetical protein
VKLESNASEFWSWDLLTGMRQKAVSGLVQQEESVMISVGMVRIGPPRSAGIDLTGREPPPHAQCIFARSAEKENAHDRPQSHMLKKFHSKPIVDAL